MSGAEVVQLNNGGTTCLAYIVTKQGCRSFVKKLRTELVNKDRYKELFIKEYELGCKLNSPYIVSYKRLSEDEHGVCIWQEYIDGKTLNDFLKSSRGYFLKKGNIERFTLQLMEGLKCMHSHQMLHLDLKPENIMITRVNNGVKIIDLGFSYSDSYISSSGFSPSYASPEQLKKENNYTAASDIYAVGKIVNYIVAATGLKLSRKMAAIVERCCHKDPKKRFSSADEIISILTPRLRIINFYNVLKGLGIVLAFGVILSIVAVHMHWTDYLYKQWKEMRFSHYDFEYDNYYFNILSDEEKTVEVTFKSKSGTDEYDDVVIPQNAIYRNETYTVVAIGDSAFKNCYRVMAVTLPPTIKRIGEKAFYECDSLVTITVPDSVTHIGEDAFGRIDKLKVACLPRGLKALPKGIFACDQKLERLTLPDSLETIGMDAFGLCEALKDVTLPPTVHTLDRGVFWTCKSIEKLVIPANVNKIGELVFWHCEKLKDIYFLNPEPVRIAVIFKHIPDLTIHVPAESVDKYRKANYWKEFKIVPITEE